ncbi:hypothetical protein H5410_008502 [Solanum commersonii]|uniref:Uncharacterized protein n=1 Tax=Solanum commersonii TaxID=4109 RepID=A0A9J6AG65_SOLCO|nr:hypothetical protein H5410_008502 [Solanum commersonii]
MEQIAAVLFQESAFPSRHLVPSVIPKPLCKPLGSNRVLFYEDELCQAVSQNKLLDCENEADTFYKTLYQDLHSKELATS